MELVALVNKQDKLVGIEEKLLAHKKGLLHRAFSIFIFNAKGELLIQKRALNKYHSPGLWSNSCCGHPRPRETAEQGAKRRLRQEMGIKCELKKNFDFIYQKQFDNGLIEYEFDHVFTGRYDGDFKVNNKEVADWKWVGIDNLLEDMSKNPEKYTYWFKKSIQRVVSKFTPNNK